jgi:hypothetical protein
MSLIKTQKVCFACYAGETNLLGFNLLMSSYLN